MNYSIVIWVVMSITILKILAMIIQRRRIQEEKRTLSRLEKWIKGSYASGEAPSQEDRFYLRSDLEVLADNGKIVIARVFYTPVREFFPATSNFFHGAYEDTKFMVIIIPAVVACIIIAA